ncbi:tRNA pseudouridine synthase A [Sulfurimonas gotlandica GD1]|uniref:tRNA pseudouridine synthase A n=1 Tax=Sulfurimonas gotlandica (strain DSM 19862 / JCM 16533 / GD1) TaxID=929558 RepID=H1FU67_SULGG|nr:tRNA pseudouridine(38-40) synthase TruA [Sulfurimonas gotlandica]EHP31373.1 tRNA pseudouridine synthase A [Sulfurimonas gotlandica GD1]
MRCALTIAYNGTDFLGSQAQKSSSNTILGNIEKVLSQLSIDSKIIASGRTDKGVHATGQVCHIDLPEFWQDLERLKKVLNDMLSSSIQVKAIKEVDAEFHARYSAKKRVYRYLIKESKSNPFENSFITFLNSVDFNAIEKNIKLYIGEHNFANFMKTGSDTKSSIRIIYKAFAYKYKGYIILNFEANGFLRSQIRLMVGALLRLDAKELQEQLECKKNHKIKPAPSNGLYLARIKY